MKKKRQAPMRTEAEEDHCRRESLHFLCLYQHEALDFSSQFQAKWEKEILSPVECSETSLEACLTYLPFSLEGWFRFRTVDVIGRVNKEFKRRTSPMEILAGERSCYTLLAFVSL